MEKLNVKINPIVNNRSFIESKFNLARSGNKDIEIEALNFKIETHNNMKTYDIFKREELTWCPMMMNIEINDMETFITYIADFCKKTYRQYKL